MSRLSRCRAWWAHAFALGGEASEPTPAERELVQRMAEVVVRRRLSAPALMVLESGRPLSFLGSQALAFLAPFATLVFAPAEYDRLLHLLERRDGVDLLIEAIVQRENDRDG